MYFHAEKKQAISLITEKYKDKHFLFIYILLAYFLLRLMGIFSADLLVEEAYYWNYAKHLDLGYLDHPPMVAFLIDISCHLFGESEFAVRFPALFCWFITLFFSFKLTELIKKGAGFYAVFFGSILPFPFIQSLVITPDDPLLACWSASLYYLYRLVILDESSNWLKAGIALGLGLLSKYSIVLLAPSMLIFLLATPKAKKWLIRKELYLAALVSFLFFTPVLYWNTTHEWASFIFQSTRRFKENGLFSFHQFIGLLILFLTPLGFWGLITLCQFKNRFGVSTETQSFLRVFTLTPLIFFGFFSLTHEIKFNWIGPSFLTLIPWLALEIKLSTTKIKKYWLLTAILLFLSYSFILANISLGKPERLNQILFKKFISWHQLTIDLYQKAVEIEKQTGQAPIFMPLDLYNLSSELAYYQNKAFQQDKINHIYPIVGRHLLAGRSLMYEYWSPTTLKNKAIIILISKNPNDFIQTKFLAKSKLNLLWSYSQGSQTKIRPYYYQVVEVL